MIPTDELRKYNESIIAEFRSNKGRVDGMPSILLLNTVGAKSGKLRTTPLAYSTDNDRIIVLAAFLGAPKNPAWYHNLVANPKVTVEFGDELISMRATVAKGKERQRLFNQHAKKVPVTVEYQEKTSRQIPVIILERVD